MFSYFRAAPEETVPEKEVQKTTTAILTPPAAPPAPQGMTEEEEAMVSLEGFFS
jgi:hypothetical protein